MSAKDVMKLEALRDAARARLTKFLEADEPDSGQWATARSDLLYAEATLCKARLEDEQARHSKLSAEVAEAEKVLSGLQAKAEASRDRSWKLRAQAVDATRAARQSLIEMEGSLAEIDEQLQEATCIADRAAVERHLSQWRNGVVTSQPGGYAGGMQLSRSPVNKVLFIVYSDSGKIAAKPVILSGHGQIPRGLFDKDALLARIQAKLASGLRYDNQLGEYQAT